ncbi:sodium:proton antiporter [Mycobacterium angelicum]|nr:sodium:proton antiporter [Mycobacterium angelicum]
MTELPVFGHDDHLYRDLAVAAAFSRATANVVASVNFDQRALDTLVEESILLGSVTGVMTLLRPAVEEREYRPPHGGTVLDSTRLVGYVMLPVTLALGVDVIVHGHLTPGGGFQGGVVLAAGLHLLYVTGSFRVLDRLRPVNVFDIGEALGAAAFVVIGLAGVVAGGVFLQNLLPTGTMGNLFSGGSVALLNIAVGVEVACGMTVLLAQFLAQEITIVKEGGGR